MHKYLVKGKVSDDDNDDEDISELDDKEVEWLIANDDNPQKLRQLQINLLKIFELFLDTNGDDSVMIEGDLSLFLFSFLFLVSKSELVLFHWNLL